jgi:hypothetical protein
MKTDPFLWERLVKYEIDDPKAAFAFSDRLCRENDWEGSFAARALEEYKRFLYLACVSGHEVTPSDEVDKVWHLHLLYTHYYWNDLCATVLLRPLHHGPTKGGARENNRYRENYRATLDSYEREFDETPPADLWPEIESRFAPRGRMRAVDADSHWVIRKPHLPQGWLARLGIPVALLALIMVDPAVAQQKAERKSDIFGLIVFIGFGCAIAIVLIRWALMTAEEWEAARKRNKESNGGCGGSGGCSSGSSGCGGGGCS